MSERETSSLVDHHSSHEPGASLPGSWNGCSHRLAGPSLPVSQGSPPGRVKSKPVKQTENEGQLHNRQHNVLSLGFRAVACMPLRWSSQDGDATEVWGILYVDSEKTKHAHAELSEDLLDSLTGEAVSVLEQLKLVEAFEERKALEKELALAQETQTALLPQTLPQLKAFSLAAFSRPTRHLGGDFYDFLDRSDRALTGVLADVSGKGLSAALLSSHVQGALQMECRSSLSSLEDSVSAVNECLCRHSESDRFVTMFLFSIDEDGSGEYVSAGHNPAYLYRAASREVEALSSTGLILGAFASASYESATIDINCGDVLVVYSDGITEAENPEEEFFGEERLIEVIRNHAHQGCHELKRMILSAVEEFTEGLHPIDDMTGIIVQMC